MKRKQMKKIRKEYGITLIALVVTIIILLILAGVALNVALGENGLFKMASQSGETAKDAAEEEKVKLAVSAAFLDGTGTLSTTSMQKAFKKEFGTLADDKLEGNGPWTFEGERNTYRIETNGKIERLGKSDISISLTIKGTPVAEEDIPIPAGFVHVGGSINEGYVISDNPADENQDVDSDDLKGNQFVWVPVDKDQRIAAKVESKEEITSIVVTDPFETVILTENNKGTTYNNEGIEPTINGEYKIKVTTTNGETSKTLEVYSLYAQTFWETDEILLKDLEEVLKEQDMTIEEYLAEYGNGMSLEEFFAMGKSQYKIIYTQYKDPEDNYKTNVNNNGGFYIGRYEAGDSSKESNNEGGTGELVTQKNKYVYNYISPTEALSKAEEYKTNLTSSLLTVAAWDRTLGWLYETGNKTIEEIVVDSTDWGNYYYDTFSGTRDLIKTGEFSNTKANNIHDLAGNVGEWTSDSGVNNLHFARGGDYHKVSVGNTSSFYDGGYPSTSAGGSYLGFRLALYLQN